MLLCEPSPGRRPDSAAISRLYQKEGDSADGLHHILRRHDPELAPLASRAVGRQTKENLTILTEATSGLKTLDFFIGEKDYQALRLALRNPPIGNLRTSARKVIINIDNKEAEEKVRRGRGGQRCAYRFERARKGGSGGGVSTQQKAHNMEVYVLVKHLFIYFIDGDGDSTGKLRVHANQNSIKGCMHAPQLGGGGGGGIVLFLCRTVRVSPLNFVLQYTRGNLRIYEVQHTYSNGRRVWAMVNA